MIYVANYSLSLLFSGKGSLSNTSIPAPAITLVDKAMIQSSSLTIGPLAVFIKNAVFFILSNSFMVIQSLYLSPP